MKTDLRRTIAIVGAGFSGTATVVHLLGQLTSEPLRLFLFERGEDFGRGLAYARSHNRYLLNVPASRMSASTADPDAFVRFAHRQEWHASGEDFLPRSLYGDYLQDLLETAIERAPPHVQVERIRGEVVELESIREGQEIVLMLKDGQRFDAHQVVLALGTPLPLLPAGISCSAQAPDVRTTPWSTGKSGAESILVIGTGLTMIDVVVAALHDNPQVKIHAISRHGLVPPTQTPFRPDALNGDDDQFACAAGSVADLTAAARRLGEEAERRGGDWREAVTLLRRQVPALWSTLSLIERERFIRHVRAFWDIHRHRAPASTLSTLAAAQDSGQLSVHAGRVQSIHSSATGVRVEWVARGRTECQSLHVAEVVNCSGPDYDVTRSSDELWRTLLAKGIAVPDDLRLGIRTGPYGKLVRDDGSVSDNIHYLGPLLRADYWETTAVGELRTYVESLARYLAAVS